MLVIHFNESILMVLITQEYHDSRSRESEVPLPNVTYSPSHRQAGVPVINIQSTLRTATDLCTNISLSVLFCSNGDSYTVFAQLDMCV